MSVRASDGNLREPQAFKPAREKRVRIVLEVKNAEARQELNGR